MSPQESEGNRFDLFSELKRRKVYRTGAAYLAVAFAVLEGADLVFPALRVGPGVYNVLVLVSVLGFPLVLALAWTFDVTEGGIRRTDPSDPAPKGQAPHRWVRLKAALVGAGFVAMVWVGLRVWRPPNESDSPGVPVEEPVLAVLPLDDLSPDPDQAYFADGLHEELLHQLGMLRGIRLTSRTSVTHFRDSPATLEAIADSLGARYIMEGSVRRASDSVQVRVRLIDASSDDPLWSEAYAVSLSLDELFGLQRDLATQVARSTGGTLAAGTGQAFGMAPTSNLEAYHAYLRGLHHWAQFDLVNIQAAVDDLTQAVELDPEFGRAHGKLAMLFAVLNNFAGRQQGEVFPLIRKHAEMAMRYAPDHPESHMAAMTLYWAIDRDWDAARQELEAALALDPDFADARWALAEWYGVIEGNTSRGLDVIQEAIRLDPFSVRPLIVRAWILTNGQRYADAVKEYETLVSLTPQDPTQHLNLSMALALTGRKDEALERIQEAIPMLPSPPSVTLAAHLARAGDEAGARKILEGALARREAGGSVAASGIAAAYATLGDPEEALHWLERSFDQEGGIYWLRAPDWVNLWDEPRFHGLWDRLGLPGDPPESDPGSRDQDPTSE